MLTRTADFVRPCNVYALEHFVAFNYLTEMIQLYHGAGVTYSTPVDTGADLGFQKGGFVLVPENVTGGATCISSCFPHQGFSFVPENVTGGATC